MLATFVVLFFHITGCSDTWSMKALRTGGLAQFKVPVYDSVPWTKLESAIPSGDNVKLFVTHAGYGQGMHIILKGKYCEIIKYTLANKVFRVYIEI